MMSNSEPGKINVVEVIRKSRFGDVLEDIACEKLADSAKVRSFPGDTIIFHEGDHAEGIYIVVNGIVKLLKYRPDGSEVLLHLAEKNDVVAEGAVFLGRYPATAITNRETSLLFIGKESVFQLAEIYPGFSKYLYDTMADWLQRLVQKIDQLTLNDATARLSRYLISLIEENQSKQEDQGLQVTLPVKKGDLATLLNMNQATLSRSLKILQDKQIITVKGRLIEIHRHEMLSQLTLPPLG